MSSVSLVPIKDYFPQQYHDLEDDYALDEEDEEEEDGEGEEDDEDGEDMPYHARKNARPFTYGTLPDGFKTSELNHVEIPDGDENHLNNNIHNNNSIHNTNNNNNNNNNNNVYKESITQISQQQMPTPKFDRKTIRPSISPSRPIIHKTPTREEFEEMLMERQKQALHQKNNLAVQQLTQNAAIQRDIDELQEKFNKNGIFGKSISESNNNNHRLVHLETINLSDDNNNNGIIVKSSHEPALMVASLPDRPETPDFPVDFVGQNEDRFSPYPMLMRKSQERLAVQYTKSKQRQPEGRGIVDQKVEPHLVQFVKDSSEFWYKPHMSRDDAVALLLNATPGSFIIRNSTTYKNAYGLVLRVAKPPPGAYIEDGTSGLVRHYLLEPTAQGVGIKGCPNVFTSLSALVYQHSIDQMALPCKLIIPDRDILQSTTESVELLAAQKQLLSQGAACNVLSLFTFNTEMLTGEEAIRKAIQELFSQRQMPVPLEVHFKVSEQGITLTDVKRREFLRRHYRTQSISHIGIDPDNHYWTIAGNHDNNNNMDLWGKKTIFAFVARSLIGSKDNYCHLFCDLAPTQPASAIVSFAHKIFPNDIQNNTLL